MNLVFPIFPKLVKARLRLCALEMGCNDAWEGPPTMRFERESLVCAYTLIGPTFEPTVKSRGSIRVARTYIQRFFMFPFSGGLDDLTEGSESNQIANDWADSIHAYYHIHERLATAEEPDLRYCLGVISTSDPLGLTARAAPGGAMYATLDIHINIIMAAQAPAFSSPLA